MKKSILILSILLLSLSYAFTQTTVKGKIVADTSNFRIVKVWGTHYERGYALGYLDGERMVNLIEGYIKPAFGFYYGFARSSISGGNDFSIDDNYITEAQGMAEGIYDAGHANADDFDYIDVLLGNVFFDFIGFSTTLNGFSMGCSSLMSWGDATAGTELEGKSVITRHLDWEPNAILKSSNLVVVHIPDEENEQPWVSIGFAGQMSALSGVNGSGLALFQHAMDDFDVQASFGKGYEPIWLTMRKVLESADYNDDGFNNVNDLKDAMLNNGFGYANGVLISSLSVTSEDSTTAMVAECACTIPYHTFRTNSYEDNINGDNLYSANGSIKRNDARNYEARYNNVAAHLGDGTLIDAQRSWDLMAGYSNSGNWNIQAMQFIPEDRILKVAVTDDNLRAYQKDPVVMLLDTLFVIPTVGIEENSQENAFHIYPNPSNGIFHLAFAENAGHPVCLTVYNAMGKQILKKTQGLHNLTEVDLQGVQGVFFVEIRTTKNTFTKKLVIN